MEKKAIYKCTLCGNLVESLWNGKPKISCCGQDMTKQNPNTVDAAKEKHVPIIERTENSVTVKVGNVAHPMDSDHYILFIELVYGNTILRHDLVEEDSIATATFLVDESVSDITARSYCNKHGFWASK